MGLMEKHHFIYFIYLLSSFWFIGANAEGCCLRTNAGPKAQMLDKVGCEIVQIPGANVHKLPMSFYWELWSTRIWHTCSDNDVLFTLNLLSSW